MIQLSAFLKPPVIFFSFVICMAVLFLSWNRLQNVYPRIQEIRFIQPSDRLSLMLRRNVSVLPTYLKGTPNSDRTLVTFSPIKKITSTLTRQFAEYRNSSRSKPDNRLDTLAGGHTCSVPGEATSMARQRVTWVMTMEGAVLKTTSCCPYVPMRTTSTAHTSPSAHSTPETLTFTSELFKYFIVNGCQVPLS